MKPPFIILYHACIEDTPGDESFWPQCIGVVNTTIEDAQAVAEQHYCALGAEEISSRLEYEDVPEDEQDASHWALDWSENAVQVIGSRAQDGIMQYCIVSTQPRAGLDREPS